MSGRKSKKSAKAAPPQTVSRQPKAFAAALALAVLTTAVFSRCLGNTFVFDDEGYILNNPHVTGGLTLANLLWAFTSFYGGNWHPLTWFTHQMDVQIWGLVPWGHHLTSIMLHAANAALVFIFLRMTTGALGRSAVAAALFSLHPLRVESVAWVAEHKDVLSLFFFLLAVIAWRRYLGRPSATRYAAVVVLYVLGLMAKPMIATFPFVLLLLDWWPLGRWRGQQGHARAGRVEIRLFAEKMPFFILSAFSGAIAVIAQRSESAVVSMAHYPLAVRFGNALVSYVRYLDKTLWPHELSVFYPFAGNGLPLWQWTGASLLLTAFSVLACKWAYRFPWLATGWFWFLGALVPVIGLIQVGAQSMADRYVYLPSIGLVVASVWAVANFGAVRRAAGGVSSGAVAALIVLSGTATWIQTGYWRDDQTLFTHALTVDPDNWLAHNNLGRQLLLQGRWSDAEQEIRESLRLNPASALAHFNLSIALHKQGRLEEAVTMLHETLRLKPGYSDAQMNLAKHLNTLGRYREAEQEAEKAIQLQPASADAQITLGIALENQGKPEEALQHYQEASRINPEMPEALNNLGHALSILHRDAEALPFFERALQARPDFVAPHFNRGLALERLGRFRDAEESYRRVLALRPDFAPARAALDRLSGM